MARPEPPAFIAGYVAAISVPGIPWISTSHNTLTALYKQHGRDVVDEALKNHWKAVARYNTAQDLCPKERS